MEKNPLEIFGLDYNLVQKLDDKVLMSIIKNIYREVQKKYHPDKNPGDKNAQAISSVFNQAWASLNKTNGLAEARQELEKISAKEKELALIDKVLLNAKEAANEPSLAEKLRSVEIELERTRASEFEKVRKIQEWHQTSARLASHRLDKLNKQERVSVCLTLAPSFLFHIEIASNERVDNVIYTVDDKLFVREHPIIKSHGFVGKLLGSLPNEAYTPQKSFNRIHHLQMPEEWILVINPRINGPREKLSIDGKHYSVPGDWMVVLGRNRGLYEFFYEIVGQVQKITLKP